MRVMALNVGGRADPRIQQALREYECDMYAFMETMWEEGGWGGLLFDGFAAHHCTRPTQPGRGPKPSGGITVLLRSGSVFDSPGVVVHMHWQQGIVWVDVPARTLTFALVYFSPANSALYTRGYLSDECLQTLFDGFHSARSKGHAIVCLGDFNIRTGGMGLDVLGLSEDTGPGMTAGVGQPLPGVPATRQSKDSVVPDKARADAFMLGLNACACVVLNGRAAGDAAGQPTCRHVSVVDYAIVSASLFASVQDFHVAPYDVATSQDHRALLMTLSLYQPACQRAGVGGRRGPRVLRPSGNQKHDYVQALKAQGPFFSALQQRLQQRTVSVGAALRELSGAMRNCARTARGSVGNPERRAPGQYAPWFDPVCCLKRDVFRAIWLAWWRCTDAALKPLLHSAWQAARCQYNCTVKKAKREFELQRMVTMIDTYFRAGQKNYWRVFSGGKAPTCPISDVGEWSQYFSGVMGQPLQPTQLSAAEAVVKATLLATGMRNPSDFEVLNDPIDMHEIAAVMQDLPPGRAADPFGMTCELLSLAAALDGNCDQQQGGPPEYKCAQFVECVSSVVQQLFDGDGSGVGRSLPEPLQISKTTPVPKPAAVSTAALHKANYRPVCVGNVFGKVLERVMNNRFDGRCEELGIRTPTQCGFRRGHGTLDALFTLRHLVDRSRSQRQRLYAIFVDFAKAFDTVPRDALLGRCRQLGVHGQFLEALLMLYDRVLMKVSVNGCSGDTFETYVGTKQGSELSPLLFGLFIDWLHELIAQQVPGAGHVIGSLKVPELMYADDVTLLARNPQEANALLDCLSLFCKLFGMQVNMAPHKTCLVIFRKQGMPQFPNGVAPDSVSYRGQPIAVAEKYTYLGVLFHATKSLTLAATELAASGRRAMYALVPRLRLHHISQFDMRCRMFDVLVEPVMSYASHIWGPDMFAPHIFQNGPPSSDADQLHLQFLRWTARAGKRTDIEVLLREFHRAPMVHRWAVLAANWWEKLRGMAPARLASQVWVADLELMLSGCRACWSFKVLSAFEKLGLVSAAQWRPGGEATVASIRQLELGRDVVQTALLGAQRRAWESIVGGTLDPRTGPSTGTMMRTHTAWVHDLSAGVRQQRSNAPLYQRLCLPLPHLHCLVRYRLGGQHLRGRQEHVLPRGSRTCLVCGSSSSRRVWRDRMMARCGALHDEDLLHVVLECPAYDHVRERYHTLVCTSTHPAPSAHRAILPAAARMLQFFEHDEQEDVIDCIRRIDTYRASLLGLRLPEGVRVFAQPVDFVPADPRRRCAADGGSRVTPRVPYVWLASLWCVVLLLCCLWVYQLCWAELFPD